MNETEATFFTIRKNLSTLGVDATGYWSYPIIIDQDDQEPLTLYLILKASRLLKKNATALYRPKAAVITDPDSRNLVAYMNYYHGKDAFPSLGWDKPLAVFPHESVRNLTYEEYADKEKELIAGYPEARSTYIESTDLSDTFRSLYLELTHPAVLPFIEHLAKPFFQMLTEKGS